MRSLLQTGKINGRIFILENKCTAYEPLCPRLQSYGLDVVANGENSKILTLIEEAEIDIVLLDIRMPDLDGFKLCRSIKQNVHTAHIPVLLMTTTNKHADRIRSIEVEADKLLIKPLADDELMLCVYTAIADKKKDENFKKNYHKLCQNNKICHILFKEFVRDTSGILQKILGNAELLKLKYAYKLDSEAVDYFDKIEENSKVLMHVFDKFRKTIPSENRVPPNDMSGGRQITTYTIKSKPDTWLKF